MSHSETSSSPVSRAANGDAKQHRQQPAHTVKSTEWEIVMGHDSSKSRAESVREREGCVHNSRQSIEIIWQQKHLTMERANNGTDNYSHTIHYSAIKIGILCRVVFAGVWQQFFFSLHSFSISPVLLCALIESIIARTTTSLLFFCSVRSRFAFSTKSTGNKTIRAVIHFMICVRCFSNCSTVVRSVLSRNRCSRRSSHPNATVSLLVHVLLPFYFFFFFLVSATTMMPLHGYKSLTSNINQMKYVHRAAAAAAASQSNVVCLEIEWRTDNRIDRWISRRTNDATSIMYHTKCRQRNLMCR